MNLLRRWRVLLATLVLAGVAAAGLVLGLPPLLQGQIETRASALLGRELRLERVEVSLLRLSLTLHGLRLAAAAGDAQDEPQLAVQRLHLDASLRSAWRLAPVIEALVIEQPQLRLARLPGGGWDIDDVLARLQASSPQEAPAEPEAPARFALFNLQLSAGELRFEDRGLGGAHHLRGLQLALPFLSNLPEDIPVHVQPRLAFVLDGAAADLSGRTLPFATDRATELQLQWQALPLDAFWRYLPAGLGLAPEGGWLSARLALRFAQPPGQAPVLALQGQVQLQDLAVAGAAPGTRVAVKTLTLALDDVQPLQRRVALGELAISGLAVTAQRDAAGQLAWPGPAASAAAAPAAAGPTPGAPWAWSLARVALQDSSLTWVDAAVAPAATWRLADLAFSAQALRWPAVEPWPVQAQARLLAGAGGTGGQDLAATLAVQGQAGPDAATVDIQIGQLQLARAAAYLKPWLQPRLQGEAALQAQLRWAAGPQPRLQLAVAQASVAPLQLLPNPAPRRARPLAQWARLELQDLQIDLLERRLSLARLQLQRPELALLRTRDGTLDLPGGWRAAPGAVPAGAAQAAEAAEVAPSPPWRVDLADVQLDGGRLHWRDEQPAEPVDLQLQGLGLRLQGLAWPPAGRNPPARWALQARLPAVAAPAAQSEPARPAPGAGRRGDQPAGPAARLAARGTLALAPARLQAELSLERLPLHALAPYFNDALPVRLARGELGWQGRITARLPASGDAQALTLDAEGAALLADLDLRTPADAAALASGTQDDQLLGWASLQLKPLRVQLAPASRPRIEIGEIALSDFYSRLIITEEGRFNLRDVQPGAAPAAAGADAATATATPAPPAAAAAAPAAPAAPGLPFDLVVGGTRLDGGRVDFSDRFVRPNYSAQLTELNGRFGRFDASRPAELATVDLRGRVAGTGRLEIRGAFNPTAQPLALDIQARTTDLELAPLSPYSGKYAGYGIERGKLSVDLAYKVAPDGALQARNHIVLNQLTFGAATDSPDATKLPVRLALALLTDRNGVVDLDLPVSGSINDPQFSIWGIVWKILGNLLSKALTSPFALLSGGGADELSRIEFVPGTARLAEGAPAALGKIAQALQDRPTLRLTLAGHADPVAERAALQAAAVDARLLAELRRDLARAGTPAAATEEAGTAALQALGSAERARLLKRLYTDTPLPDRPRNLIGLLKDVPAAEMRARLEAAVAVTPDSARELALQRSLRVRDLLIERGLASERLFLAGPKLGPQAAAAPAAPAAASAPAASPDFIPQVELGLALP